MKSTPCWFAGHEKDAWPELLHSTLDDALTSLKSSGMVENVYVQPPSSGSPPANPGTSTDVWLYTDGNGAVYEIPKRGVWHPNRMRPLHLLHSLYHSVKTVALRVRFCFVCHVGMHPLSVSFWEKKPSWQSFIGGQIFSDNRSSHGRMKSSTKRNEGMVGSSQMMVVSNN